MAGRKSLYEQLVKPNLDRIPKWRREGFTEVQVGKRLGILSKTTITRYKNKYPEFAAAMLKGKHFLIDELEDSLYKRALGFEYEETERIVSNDGKYKRIKKTKKYHVPDVGALCFALKNLAPDKWKDRNQTELTGKDGGAIEIGSPRDEITSRIACIAAKLGKRGNTQEVQ